MAESKGFPGSSEVKASACNAGELGLIPRLGRSLGEGNSNPLQYSCLENPIDRGVWWAILHGVAESDTTERFHFLSFRHKNGKSVIFSYGKEDNSSQKKDKIVGIN